MVKRWSRAYHLFEICNL